jgi:hypothetical protein
MEKRLCRGLIVSLLRSFGIYQEISVPPVAGTARRSRTTERAVSERGSGISPVSHILLTRRCRLFSSAT